MTRGQHRRPELRLRERLAKLLAGGGTHRNHAGDDAAPKPAGAPAEGRHRSRDNAA
ncbi:MAG: hypothetical protein ACRDMV_06805 [Streptosporangiales bacterium]